MPATHASVMALLKEFYPDNEVAEQINDEIDLLTWAKKSTMTWNGREIRLPVHLTRNTGVGFIPDGGTLPTAGQQGTAQLVITSTTLTARAQITWKAMKAGDKVGAGAVADAWDFEVERLKKDVANRADVAAFSGNQFKGLLNEHVDGAAAPDTTGLCTVAAPAAGTRAYEYFGDLQSEFHPFAGVVTANATTWVRVRCFRQDTYAEVFPFDLGAAAELPNDTIAAIFVSAFDAVACTVSLSVVRRAAVPGAGEVDFRTSQVAAGFPCSLALHATQFTDSVGAAFGTQVAFANEPRGILMNLCSPQHYTVDRTTAVGTAVALQAVFRTQATAGLHARAAVSAPRMMALDDTVLLNAGKETDMLGCAPLSRSAFLAAVTQNPQFNVKMDGSADIGVKGASLLANGKKLKIMRHVPRGGYLMLTTESWELFEYAPGEWMDAGGGSMLHWVANTAQYEAAWIWDYQLVCKQPNANGGLIGTTI